jgi:hypothetical protein
MAFPPNYRQNRQDRARVKDKKAREKEIRREERRQQKSERPAEQPSPLSEIKTDKE